MATTSFPIISFNGGEWSPELYRRVDLPKYYSALQKARNLILTPRGAAKKRPGTKLIGHGDHKAVGGSWVPNEARLIPFVFAKAASSEGASRSYVLLLEAEDGATSFYFRVICPALGDVFLPDSSYIDFSSATYQWTACSELPGVYYLEKNGGGPPPGFSTFEDVENIFNGPLRTSPRLTYCGEACGYPWTHPELEPRGYVLVSEKYAWVKRATSNAYYAVDPLGGGDPHISDFPDLYMDAKGNSPEEMAKQTVAPSAAKQWAYGDFDSLGFNTVYVYLPSGADPSTFYEGYLYGKFLKPLPEGGWAYGTDPSGFFNTVYINVGGSPGVIYARKDLRVTVTPKSTFSPEDLSTIRFAANNEKLYLFHRKWGPVVIERGSDDYTWTVSYPRNDTKWRGPVGSVSSGIVLDGIRAFIQSEVRWTKYGTNLWYLSNEYGEGLDRGPVTAFYDKSSGTYGALSKQTSGVDPDSTHPWNMLSVNGIYTLVLYSTSDPNTQPDGYYGASYEDQKYAVTVIDDNGFEGLPYEFPTKGGLEGSLKWDKLSSYENYHLYRKFKGKFSWIGTNNPELNESGTPTKYIFTLSTIIPDSQKGPPSLLDGLSATLTEVTKIPAVGTFHQQRLVLARSDERPGTIWGSMVGYADAFTAQEPPRADDAYTFALAMETVSEILWMVSFRDLLIGTSGGIWVVSGGPNSAAITPTDIQAERQIDWGAWDVPPVVVGNSLIFVQAGGKVVRNASYAQASLGLMSADLTVLADHLFEDRRVARMAYQKWPHQTLWVVGTDGELVSMVYSEEHQVYAWARQEFAGAGFKDVVTVPSAVGDEDLVYFLTERRILSYDYRLGEKRLPEFEGSVSLQNGNFLDFSSRLSGSSKVSVVVGLQDLNLEEVDVIADGKYLGRRRVQDGIVHLDTEAYEVYVGLPIESDLLTMDLVLAGKYGTTADKKRGTISVFFSFFQSAGTIYVGGEEAGKEELSALEISEDAVFSGELEGFVKPAGETESKIYVYDDYPGPLCLRCIYGRGSAGVF
jgi:hypothetical protein